jgi:hypothetical protein
VSFHRFVTDEGDLIGSFEVFHKTAVEIGNDWDSTRITSETTAGWYWWACFPGCLPDGEPMGPFETEQDAIESAQGDMT